jgi:hypothetical protein
VSRRPQVPAGVRRTVAGRGSIVIRRPGPSDSAAVGELFELAERPSPSAPLLVAESDGRLVAAVSTVTGEAVSDPFVPAADVIALLRLRAAQLDAAA